MTDPGPSPAGSGVGRASPRGSLRPLLLIFGTCALVVACLYWARPVLRPLALAILFTFLLAPAVDAARRLGIGRVLSVCLVVVLSLILLAGTGWVIGLQVNGLAHQLPQYVGNLKEKVADLRALSRGGALEKLQETAKEVTDEIKKNDEARKPDEEKPVPVVVEDPKPVPLDLPVSPGTLLEALASGRCSSCPRVDPSLPRRPRASSSEWDERRAPRRKADETRSAAGIT